MQAGYWMWTTSRRRAPHLLQVVVGALLQRKEVYDNRPEVDEHPAAVGRALGTRARRRLVRELVEAVDHGPRLAHVVDGADDEVVGEGEERGQIEQDDIRHHAIDQGVDDAVRQFVAVQIDTSANVRSRPAV